MKWTADNDQLLFIKLIETHDVAVKAEKIREAWPKDGREIPTARAISERILRIRNALKNTNSNDGSGTSKVPGSVPSTPRKRKNTAAGTVTETSRTSKSRRIGKPAANAAVNMAHAPELGGVGTEFDIGPVDPAGIFYSFGNYGNEN